MVIESSGRPIRAESPRGFESEPSDEWREDYGRGGAVRSNEPERDWFFEQNANCDTSTPDLPNESSKTSSVASMYPDRRSYKGHGPIGYRPRDERIQELLCERLTEHPGIDATEISVAVDSGIVKVQGTVKSDRMKRTLLQTIRGSLGVIGVLDDIDVDERPPK